MLSTVLGSLLGFAGSAIGPIVGIFEKREEAKLEIQKMEQASQMAKAGFNHDQVMYTLKSKDEEHQRLLDHDIEISKGTGFVSSLQKLVRPLITYAFFGLFATVEISLLMNLLNSDQEFSVAIMHVWDDETQAIFAAVITFWFGNRVFEKSKKISH